MHSICYLSQQFWNGLRSNDIDTTQLESDSNNGSILEEIIEIKQHELGIRFGDGIQSLVIQEVFINSIASKFGLICGDKLTKINNKSLSNLSPSSALQLFLSTSLPFLATFEKSITYFVDEKNSNTFTKKAKIVSKKSNKPAFKYDIDIAALLSETNSSDESISNSIQSVHNMQSSAENTPYSPKYDIDMDSPSLQTPEPTPYHKLKKQQEHIQLLKDLLSDNDKAIRLTQMQFQMDDIFTDNKSEKYSESELFIKTFLINDTMFHFNDYLSQKLISNDHETHTNTKNQNTPTISSPQTTKKPSKLRLKLAEMSNSATLNQKINVRRYADDRIIAILSNNGLCSGVHEWSFKILECNTNRQEIGVIAMADIKKIKINAIGGINNTNACSARAIYGNELLTNSSYYASYNRDGSKRCFRDLSKKGKSKIGWTEGDVITVHLDLNKWKIKFLLNGANVRKTISLQRNLQYYPIISFCGHCRYELISFR